MCLPPSKGSRAPPKEGTLSHQGVPPLLFIPPLKPADIVPPFTPTPPLPGRRSPHALSFSLLNSEQHSPTPAPSDNVGSMQPKCRRPLPTLLLAAALGLSRSAAAAEIKPPAPDAHWPLAGGLRDSVSGRSPETHGTPPTPAPGPSLAFGGRGNWLEIAGEQTPRFGTGDFTLAVWMHVDDRDDRVPGDLISQYDPARRRGFILSLKSNPGVTSNQANWRQLQFGIDDNQASSWQDSGRPGQALFAFALASHHGDLFAGTCEPGRDQSGRVYRLTGTTQWVDCGAPDQANSVTSLATHQGNLYAGTGKYRVAGSALPESENTRLGGRVLRYAGGTNWIDCGQLPNTEAVGGMVSFQGRLHASSLYKPAGFFRHEGGTRWTDCGTPAGIRVVSLTVHDGFLYAGSYDVGKVFRYDGREWLDCGQVGDGNTQTYSFTSHEGQLLVGTWPSGRVYRLEQPGRWTDLGRLGNELEVMGMVVHNGRLIAGTLPLAEVHSYEADGSWKRLQQLDATPDVKYRRAWTMAEHDGRLYCSTLPSGKVFSFQAGCQATAPQPVSTGWHHVAAQRKGDRLRLYLDGRQVAESRTFDGTVFNLETQAPLRLGAGPTGTFQGRLADLRLYRKALSPAEMAPLVATPPEQ